MARHLPGSTEFDFNLENARTDAAVNAMLDNPDWRRCHLPETLSWVHSTSITLIGDILVAIIMLFVGIEPIEILAHIRMMWENEIANLPTLRAARDAPIYGSVAGDEPPPPPRTKIYYYLQLNTKHGISL